jgi:predicted nucleic acid-binding protein
VSDAGSFETASSYLSKPPAVWPGEGFVEGLREALRAGHLAGAQDAIVGVGDDGAFLETGLLGRPGLPLVVDANWLRSDLLRSCTGRQQTVMLTAANRGLVRLYCAPHVLDEVVEHYAEWATGKDLPAAEVLQAWRRAYLPLLRRVDPPAGLLSAAEQARIDLRASRDTDDVPSATLALLLQAPFISTDRQATRAVYGPEAALRRQDELLRLMSAAGDTVRLRQLGTIAALLPAAGGPALMRAASSAVQAAPAATLLAVAALGLSLAKVVPAEGWRGLRRVVGRGLELGAGAVTVYRVWCDSIRAATPDEPQWEELAAGAAADLVLARALMRTLAHGSRDQMTVTELVAALPAVPVGQSERPVQHALRSHRLAVFQEIGRGRWQLGGSPAHLTGPVG